ncbi:hypothetical protein [Sphingobacterium sp. R2]|uniref:hypothetical protein n=1 Tax=Sphingobacterium sp. R2 TaxID=3112958 RepID=UPI00345CF273
MKNLLLLFLFNSLFSITLVKASLAFDQGVNIKDFGGRADGITNNLTALEAASYTARQKGTFVFIPKSADSRGYYVDGNAKIYSSVKSDGATISSPSKHNKIFFLQNPGIIIENLRFSIENDRLLVNAPIAIEINGMSNVTIQNCDIVNGRIYSRNTSREFSKNISIIKNRFTADFSNYQNYTIQNDIIQILNINGLNICNNSFDIKNSNRIIKVTSTDTNGELFSDNIKILGNNIKSVTNSKKQVIDLYMFTKDIEIRNNVFNSVGHNSIIENKTTADRFYKLNLVVSDNQFITDGTSLRLYGSFGNVGKTSNGIQNVIFSGNKVENTSASAVSINIAHYQDVKISGNVFNRGSKGSSSHFRLAGIDRLSIVGNKISGGNILLTDEKVIEDKKYNSSFNKINILNNEFSSSNPNALIAGIYNGSNIGDLSIEGNNFNNQTGTLIEVKNSNVRSIQVNKLNPNFRSIKSSNSQIRSMK